MQGVINNFAELEELIYNNKEVDIICLNETHMVEDDDENLIKIDGYKIVQICSHSRHTGGVLMYIKNQCSCELVNRICLTKELWWLHVRINCGNNYVHIIGLYRSPRYLNIENEFFINFNQYLEELSDINAKIIVMGDFNIDWLDTDSSTLSSMKEILEQNMFKQLVNEYTRISPVSKTLIDWVVVNCYENVNIKIDPDKKISDHETLEIIIHCQNYKLKQKERKDIKILKYNKNNFINKICRSDLGTIYYEDCNTKASKFSMCFRGIVEEFVVKKKIVPFTFPWYTNELKLIKQERDTQYKRAIWTDGLDE